MIDKISIEAAKEITTKPNSGEWLNYENRDCVLDVARTFLKTVDMVKAEKKKAKALRAELKESRRLLKKAADFLESANNIIQEGADAEEGDDEDAKAFIEDLREFAS